MQNHLGHQNSSHPHIDALLSRHTTLDQMIQNLSKSPSADDVHLRSLKKSKLKLADEIDDYQRRTG